MIKKLILGVMNQEYDREEIKKRLEILTRSKVKRKHIRSITVNPASHMLPKMTIEVGKVAKNMEPGAPPEKVLFIFEADAFLVCTESRGANNGLPYFFVRGDVRNVEVYE